MKKLLSLIAVLTLILATFTACSKDDYNDDSSIKENIIGTWEGTAILIDGKWIDITKYPYSSRVSISATFYKDGTYYGRGSLGTGSGTYKVNGKTIETYVGGKLYLKYKVKEMTSTTAELTIIEGSSSIDVKVKKVKSSRI